MLCRKSGWAKAHLFLQERDISMSQFQIAFKLSTLSIVIQTLGDATPAGYNLIGTFHHGDSSDLLGDDPGLPSNGGVLAESHVLWQHVRDALYHVNATTGLSVPGTRQFPNNITNMQGIKITIDTVYTQLTSFAVTSPASPLALSLAGAHTSQIALTFTPSGASNQVVTYHSSDATKATVSGSGLITGLAIGQSTITVTTNDGGFTHNIVVNVGA